jgi:hypothetical protein
VNGWKLDQLPRFEPTNVDPPALDQLSGFISATAGAGMQWFPDPELEKYIREIARLPEMTDEDVDYKREMYQQQQMMEFGAGQMELLGMKQKAEMAAQGMTPEQAELHAQTPAPETQEQELSMAEQQAALQNQPPPEDPNAIAQHGRDLERMSAEEKTAQSSHGREKEKMRLQDVLAERDHKRTKEQLRLKDRSAASSAKLQSQSMREKERFTAKTAAAKKTAAKKPAAKKTAKKPPPKKGR